MEKRPEPNVRKCKMCGKVVNFSEPFCEHETMEESAWLNIPGTSPNVNNHEHPDKLEETK